MGQVIVQPKFVEGDDLEKATLVVFPMRIEKAYFNAAVEWAASTQTPIFCVSADVARFEAEGFGSYRFHRLEGFKEVDFQGGAVVFFPAQQRLQVGLRSWTFGIAKRLGLANTQSFHLLIRPKKERPILFLTSTLISASEWEILSREQPEMIVGCEQVPRSEWLALSMLAKRRIIPAVDLAKVEAGTAEGPAKETPWRPKAVVY